MGIFDFFKSKKTFKKPDEIWLKVIEGMKIVFQEGIDDFEDDEEYEEYEDFERSDYISERFFKEDGKEIPAETYFDKYSQEYEEADWVEEALFPSLEEAEKHAKLIINEILKN
tara:strand:- start:245 stop:583 length:339 start_codon:yes stop_codon:yes gene_type:complete